jgi:hypothetical protein
MNISKSQYVRALQCHKALWLYKNKKELMSEPDCGTRARFAYGDIVGDLACELFGGGVEIEYNPDDFDSMIAKTDALIFGGVDTIYEATFREDGVLVMVDILHKNKNNRWDIYEVKSSSSLKGYHINDASVQYYVLNSAGLEIESVNIIHLNKEYKKDKILDIKGLFTIVDITDKVLSLQDAIKTNLNTIESMLQKDIPNIEISEHCSSPFVCDFYDYCHKDIPKESVFNLYRLEKKKKYELYKKGILKAQDLPDDYKLTKAQTIQIESLKSDNIHIQKDELTRFLDSIEFPISFFDFETYMEPVPRFDNQSPQARMPFQYSLHILHKDGTLVHKEYLADEMIDPRRDIAIKMIDDIPKEGTIVAYFMPFEKGVIKELSEYNSEYKNELIAMSERFVDLMVPFKNLWYYHPRFNGSFSIKSILPAIVDDKALDYKSLDIQNGDMAMNSFANLHNIKDKDERYKIRQGLLKYCHLDTLAMVKIYEKLKEAINI